MREDDLVAAIAALAQRPSRKIVLGIGDDAALWRPSRSNLSAITTDLLVEGVDFTRALMSLEDAGYRAMSANASDLAAMGARPVLATVALGLPAETAPDDALAIYRGLRASADAAALAIAGGDLSRAPAIVIGIAAVGEVRPSDVKRRAGGRAGDVIAVTAPLGASRAGLRVASGAVSIDDASAAAALQAFRRPAARCDEGRFLAASRSVGAMMDCSDGLSIDLERLCTASGAGAEIDDVPFAACVVPVASALGEDPERFALAGGEDFELIVAVRPRAFAHVARRYRARFGRELLRVGTLCAQPGIRLRGREIRRCGWDHFAAPAETAR